MRTIGLHLRLTTTVSELLKKAIRLESPIVQCFFISQGAQEYIDPSEEEVALCKELSKQFEALYVHASYWVNLTGCKRNGWYAFKKELALAEKLGFTHIILHPGSATGCATKEEGIAMLAKALNSVTKEVPEIKIILENTAHASMTIGGNLQDFKALLALLDFPDRIGFCIDTAHAHSFGYDIVKPHMQDLFMDEIEATIGAHRLALLHVNETPEACGSYIDRHVDFSDGAIGIPALKRFINHPLCKKIPIILEPPVVLTEEEERSFIDTVSSWEE